MNKQRANVLATSLSAVLAVFALAGCPAPTNGNADGGDVVTVTLSSIALTPDSKSIAVGTTFKFVATATLSDKTTKDLSSTATWSSADAKVATVSSAGEATAVAPGTAVITAEKDGVKGTATLTVTAAKLLSIALSNPKASISKGTSVQLTATGTYDNNTTQDLTAMKGVTWTSSDSSIAAVDAGLVHGAAVGTAKITVTDDATKLTADTQIAVTDAVLDHVSVEPLLPSIPKGTPQEFTATGVFTDGTTQPLKSPDDVVWSCATLTGTGVCTISVANGEKYTVTGTGEGTATVAATHTSGIVGSTTLTVTAAQLVSMTIAPATLPASVPNGLRLHFTATGVFTDSVSHDITNDVTWDTADHAVAVIANADNNADKVKKGDATGKAVGSTDVTATLHGITSPAVKLTVTDAVLSKIELHPGSSEVAKGLHQQFDATGIFSDGSNKPITADCTWTSSDTSVATVSNTISTKDPVGNATTLKVGPTTISAVHPKYTDVPAGTALLTVTGARVNGLLISPAVPQLPRGMSLQFQASALYTDGSAADVTTDSHLVWSSENALVTGISTGGLAGPASDLDSSTHTTRITAIYSTSNGVNAGPFSAVTVLTVTPAIVDTLSIGPTSLTLPVGVHDGHFVATAAMTDGNHRDITNDEHITWSSSAPTIAQVSNAGGAIKGNISPLVASSDTVIITATYAGLTKSGAIVTGTGSVTVTAAQVVDFIVQPFGGATVNNVNIPPVSISSGSSRQFQALAAFTDGTSSAITSSATWSVEGCTPIGAGSLDGSKPGYFTANHLGTCTISASAKAGHAQLLQKRQTVVKVEPPYITQVSVTPTDPTATTNALPSQFHATALFSDGHQADISKDPNLAWTSSVTSVATIGNDNTHMTEKGVVKIVASGTSVITAKINNGTSDLTGTTTLTVSNAVLQKITVEPPTPSFSAGAHFPVAAFGLYNDNTKRGLTLDAAWSSSNASIAKVTYVYDSNNVVIGVFVDAVAQGTATITATYGSTTGTSTVTVNAATLKGIGISPVNGTVPSGTKLQFTATGYYSDLSTQDLTSVATWTSSVTASATVDATGSALGLLKGQTVVTATYGGKTSNPATLNVTGAVLNSIALSPAAPSIAKGTRRPLVATGNFSDGTTRNMSGGVAWTTSDTAVATVDPYGVVFGAGTGTATITATDSLSSGIAATVVVTVTSATLNGIAVDPGRGVVAAGTTLQFHATGFYSDGGHVDLTSSATWSSSSSAVGTISTTGLATGVAQGVASISATYGGKTAPTVLLNVTQATLVSIGITPSNASIAKGTLQQFRATGLYSDNTTQDLTGKVTWTSDSTSVAPITSSPDVTFGIAYGAGQGTATITATASWTTTPVTASSTLTVNAATLRLVSVSPKVTAVPSGNSVQFHATGIYSDGSTHDLTGAVQWTAGDAAVVSVSSATDSAGVATGIAQGSTTVIATYAVDASTTMYGAAAIAVSAATLASIAVTPASVTMPKGTLQWVHAVGTFSDKSTRDITGGVTWSTDSSSVVAVGNGLDAGGKLYAVGAGSATITASMPIAGSATPKSATASVTVSSATLSKLILNPVAFAIAKGTALQMHALGIYSDGSNKDLTSTVTWAVSANTSSFASISNGATDVGTVTGLAEGVASISATDSNSSVASTVPALIKVTAATLKSLSITPSSVSIPKGTLHHFVAIGTFTDGSTRDLTSVAGWDTSDPTIATVSSAFTVGGLAYGVAQGSVTITAKVPAGSSYVSASAGLNVSAATLLGVVVNPLGTSIAAGTTVQYHATGIYTDKTTQDLTGAVTWEIDSNCTAATISNAADSAGVATGVSAGSCTVKATDASSGVASLSVGLAVRAAFLSKLDVTTQTPNIAAGTRGWYMATGTFSDGRVQDMTHLVGWKSSDPAIASAVDGVVYGVAAGSATIYATGIGNNGASVSGAAGVAVGTATLDHLIIDPIKWAMPAGTIRQFHAIGIYSDKSARDLTNDLSWSTGDATLASVNSTGVVSAIAQGTTTVKATFADSSVDSSKWISATTLELKITAATLQAIVVSPQTATIPAGGHWHFQASGLFSDGSSRDLTGVVSWSSADAATAVIGDWAGSSGWVFGVAKGNTTVSASLYTPLGVVTSQPATVNVTAATIVNLAVFPALWSIPKGTTLQFYATAYYSDGTVSDVTNDVAWSAVDAGLTTSTFAAVSNADGTHGLASGNAVGTATVTAVIGGVSQKSILNIRLPDLASISVGPSPVTIAAGTGIQLHAIGNFSDGTSMDITNRVAWDSNDRASATVVNGWLYGAAQSSGAVSITAIGAKADGKTLVTGSVSATISGAVLKRLVVTPAVRAIAKGTTIQYWANGVFSDGSVRDLTGGVTWSSSDETVASVSNADGLRGLATGVATGGVTITATDPFTGVYLKSSLTVAAQKLSSISIATVGGASTTIVKGTSVLLKATGTFTDGSTQDITGGVSWASSDPTVLTGWYAFGGGVAWGVGVGTANVTATVPNSTVTAGTLSITVKAATLTTVTVQPVSPTIAAGTTIELHAIGTFDNGSKQDLTGQVSWTSSDENSVTVTNGTDTYGVAYGVKATSAAVTVTATAAFTDSSGATSTVSGTTALSISGALVSSLAITPDPSTLTLSAGPTAQLTATATMSDGTTQDVTHFVLWESDNTGAAFVGTGPSNGGLVYGVAAGSAVITCTVPWKPSVTDETLVTIQ